MDRFRGVFPATITPMTPDGDLAEEAFRRVLEFNLAAGVHGFWIAGGTGESVLLDDDENRRLADWAVDVCRGRAVTIHHVGAVTTRRAAALAEHAAAAGVDAICCVPTFFYPRTPAEIVEHYRVAAAAADLPFFCYNLPSCTQIEITPDLMKRLQDAVPQLTGLKHSAPNFQNIRVFSRMGLATFTGSGHWLLPAMAIGAVGCIDGPPGLAPERWMAIWRTLEAGDLEAARRAQSEASDLVEALLSSTGGGYTAICKRVLTRRLGLDCGAPRPPALPLTETQAAAVDAAVDRLGLGPAR